MESQEQRIISQAIIQRLDILIKQNEKLLNVFLKAEKKDNNKKKEKKKDMTTSVKPKDF